MNVYMTARGDGVTFIASVESGSRVESSEGVLISDGWVELTRKNDDGSELEPIRIVIGDELTYKKATGKVVDILRDSVVISKGEKAKKIKATKLAEIAFPDM